MRVRDLFSRRALRDRRLRLIVPVAVLAGLVGVTLVALAPSTPASAGTLSSVFADSATPIIVTDPDRRAVQLGVRFSVSRQVEVVGIRFYKGPKNTGTHTGTLWSEKGKKLATATFRDETRSGWQEVHFASPVTVTPGHRYTASYRAPHGRYSADPHGFDAGLTDGTLSYPRSAGVCSCRLTGFPTRVWQNANYYVDVLYRLPGGSTGTPDPTVSATPTPTPSAGATSGPPATGGGASGPGTSAGLASLPRIPWEGGSAYWKQFPAANSAGWSDPSFFPITVWFNGISSDSEAQYDKKVGINTYIGMDDSTPYSLFQRNDVYWIGDPLNSSFTPSSNNWVGNFLEDETDGRYSENPAAGRAELAAAKARVAGNGRFNYANFTQMVISSDLPTADANAYVNNYTDAVSLDMYWYTIPYCSWTPYRDAYIVPVAQSNCRTASSYGKTVEALRMRDAADGKLQPIWQFVEDLNGGPGDPHTGYISPGQLQGAVMSSVINEARGIVYFNQSLSGSCQGGSVVRQVQVGQLSCASANVAAMTEVDGKIHQLAPVINTQSYQWSFGTGLDTMLKAKDGSIYVFAMVDGSSKPGSRTFRLPPGVNASSAQVMFENRSVPISGGAFQDSFANEYSYHIYKITP